MRVPEAEGPGVFRDGALGLILCTGREIRLNLDGDTHLSVRVRSEGRDDFVGDGHQAQFGRCGVDRDVAVE